MKKCLKRSPSWFKPPRSFYIELVSKALEEDLGQGDITTALVISPEAKGKGVIIAKEQGVAAGLFIAEEVFKQLDPSAKITILVEEGSTFTSGTELMQIEANYRSILMAERVALNFLQRLSGIATKTSKFCDAIKHYKAKLVCTRKTTPGLRILEKYAVRAGGGHNHRFNLSDGILIKDNHIAFWGSVSKAIKLAKELAPHGMKIEVEISNLSDLVHAIDAGADLLLLDNMQCKTVEQAVKKAKDLAPGVLLEASGNITLDNIADYAATGVDIISSGSLTHSYKSIDLSLKAHILEA